MDGTIYVGVACEQNHHFESQELIASTTAFVSTPDESRALDNDFLVRSRLHAQARTLYTAMEVACHQLLCDRARFKTTNKTIVHYLDEGSFGQRQIKTPFRRQVDQVRRFARQNQFPVKPQLVLSATPPIAQQRCTSRAKSNLRELLKRTSLDDRHRFHVHTASSN